VDWINLAQDKEKMVGYCEDCNKLPGFTKYREFLEELKNC